LPRFEKKKRYSSLSYAHQREDLVAVTIRQNILWKGAIQLNDKSGHHPGHNLTGWEEVDCIVCGEKTPSSVFWHDEARGNMVRCLTCGLVFRTPRRLEQSIGQDFTEQWTENRPPFTLMDYRVRSLSMIARWILHRHPEPGSILDIGSSYGTLLGMFPESWLRVGIEPSGTACQVARKRLPKAQIIHSLFGNASLPEASFDVITMVDMIYYLPFPIRDLQRVKRLLKPGGVLVIESQNFTNRGYVYRWARHPFCDTWMYFYTPSSFERVLNKSGLEIVGRIDLPGVRIGSLNLGERLITWAEFALTKALMSSSFRQIDLVPHFVFMCKASTK
jgi:SAM-dependent methyltransferase